MTTRRKWQDVLDRLAFLKEQGLIVGYVKQKNVASVEIVVTENVRHGPYSIREAYAWLEGHTGRQIAHLLTYDRKKE